MDLINKKQLVRYVNKKLEINRKKISEICTNTPENDGEISYYDGQIKVLLDILKLFNEKKKN